MRGHTRPNRFSSSRAWGAGGGAPHGARSGDQAPIGLRSPLQASHRPCAAEGCHLFVRRVFVFVGTRGLGMGASKACHVRDCRLRS
eukprot:4950240-Prymnesium_polylepis.1